MADGKVEYEVRADTSKITSDLNAVNQIVQRSAQETQKKVDNIGKTAVDAIKPMTDAAEKAVDSIDDLGKEAGDTAKEVKQLGEETDDTADKTDDLGKEAEETAKKIKEQGEQSKKSAEHTDKLRNSVDKVKDSVKDAKEQIGKYAAAAGAAFVAVGTAAVKSAADAETSFAKVKTLLSDGIMVDDYYNSIKKASANTGVGFGSMAESVYSAISASVDESKAVEFTENAVKLAKGGFTETATAVDVLTTAINAYGKSADDATHISDVLITTQNAGKTTVDELARSMGQTIPIANSANTAIEDLSTQYAVLTKNGVPTAESGTQIKAMLSELSSSGTKASEALKELTGKSFAQLQSEGSNTADALNILKDHAESTGKSISDMFGSVEAGNAALTLVKDGGADFADILGQMQNSAGATEKAYETMSNTIEERINRLKNRFALAFTEVGEDLLPKIEQFADYVDDHFDEISDTISGIGEATEQAAEFLLGLTKVLWDNKEAVGAAVAGYIAFKTAMAIGNVINTVVTATKSLTTATQTATVAQEAMNVACNANPYVLLASAIIGVVGAIGTFVAANSDAEKSVEDVSVKVNDLSNAARSYKDSADGLDKVADKYEEIYNSEKTTAEKADELKTIQEELTTQYGNLAGGIDLVNGKYDEQIEKIRNLAKEEKDLAIANAREALLTAKDAENNYTKYFTADNYEEQQQLWWMENNLGTYNKDKDVQTWTWYGSKDKYYAAFDGTYEEIAADMKEYYDHLVAEGASEYLIEGALDAWNEAKAKADELKEIQNNFDLLTDSVEESADSIENAASASDTYANTMGELAKAQDDLKKQNAELDETSKKLIEDYGGLYDELKNLENGGALNYEQMRKLIELYPELESKIKLTADGYTLETDALGDLRGALDDSVTATIEAERTKTQAAIEGARERINALSAEASALAKMGQMTSEKSLEIQSATSSALAEIAEAEERLGLYDTLGGYIKGGKGKNASSSSGSGSSGGSSSGKTTSGKGGLQSNEDTYDKEYKDLKYQYDMGEIDAKTFYDRVDSLRDDYLEKDSDKWRSVNVARHNWEESERKKAEAESKKSSTTSSTKSSKSSGSSKGNIISITSYIPTVWDTDEDKSMKLNKSAMLELAAKGQYSTQRHITADDDLSSVRKSASTVGSTVASTAPTSSASKEATLSDVVSALKDIKFADEKHKISFEVTMKARDLTIGKVAVDDINDITKMTGKSPLILK